jgi:cytidine deaminase
VPGSDRIKEVCFPAVNGSFFLYLGPEMKKQELRISYTEFEDRMELPLQDKELLDRATAIAGAAYAPYSNFYVGAALRLKNGTVITGNNQENVAYPSGLCAERVAIYAAGALHPDSPIESIAITCRARDFEVTEPLSPCGACRQAIAEYETRHKHKIRVILGAEKGKVLVVDSIADLLPFMFMEEKLKK